MEDAKQAVDQYKPESSMPESENYDKKCVLINHFQLICYFQEEMGWNVAQQLAETVTQVVIWLTIEVTILCLRLKT